MNGGAVEIGSQSLALVCATASAQSASQIDSGTEGLLRMARSRACIACLISRGRTGPLRDRPCTVGRGTEPRRFRSDWRRRFRGRNPRYSLTRSSPNDLFNLTPSLLGELELLPGPRDNRGGLLDILGGVLVAPPHAGSSGSATTTTRSEEQASGQHEDPIPMSKEWPPGPVRMQGGESAAARGAGALISTACDLHLVCRAPLVHLRLVSAAGRLGVVELCHGSQGILVDDVAGYLYRGARPASRRLETDPRGPIDCRPTQDENGHMLGRNRSGCE